MDLINKLLFFGVLIAIFNLIECLYEDQIGKFDWKHSYIGKIKFGHFDQRSNDKIIICTEENVLAAISTKNGDILWRQIFEKSPRGNINLLSLTSIDKNSVQNNYDYNNENNEDIITVSGNNTALVRGWNSNTGNLVWEWSIQLNTFEKTDHTMWLIHNQQLFIITPVWKTHIDLISYNVKTGQQIKLLKSKIDCPWIENDLCIMAGHFYVCKNKDKLVAINLLSYNGDTVEKNFDYVLTEDLSPVRGLNDAVLLGNKIISFTELNYEAYIENDAAIFNDKKIVENENILLKAIVNDKSIKITANNLLTNSVYNDIYIVAHYPDTLGLPNIYDVKCKNEKSNEQHKSVVCALLLSTADGSIVLMQQGKMKWIREEALASIVAVELIDLPLSDAEGAIEEELNNKDEDKNTQWDMFGAFTRRLISQIHQIRNIVLAVFGLGAPPSASQKAGLVRDSFGLHKMIVVVTKVGKVYGIDNLTGKYHWMIYLKNIIGFNNGNDIKILIQRTSKHFPNPAQCAIIAKDEFTGNGVIYQFNPISGQPISNSNGLTTLNYKIQQVTLLHNTGADFLRGILILNHDNEVQVIPESSSKYAHGTYLYTVNKNTGKLFGYYVEFDDNKLRSTQTWQLNVGTNGQKIIKLGVKNPIEHVHSLGRVLNDRSVLYKYNNPNLVSLITIGNDFVHKSIINLYLIDIVSGIIIFSMSHRRCKEPINLVHSENWLVYTYYNDKGRRTELTSIELYEGKFQTNSTVWSSLEQQTIQPMVERQSYIVPGTVTTLKETITEKGITNKHVLIGLSTGGVVELPWALLDPRRPINQMREEGQIPYIPELPLPSENIINYNQTVKRLSNIHTAPSGLESTCLVFIYGLDIFVTRISPSKTFDLLKEDFDYFLITVVLIALTTSSYIVKHLSSRKALKQAWK